MTHPAGIVFAVAASALSLLNVLLFATVVSKSFKLWPTPSTKSWQHYTFWPLFRSGLSLTILYLVLTANWSEAGDPRFAVGLFAALVGIAFTVYGYFDLGIDNTYGADEGLITSGLYRYSRNPQYVASILGYTGGAVANATPYALILCALAILVYIILPFTEEPWLHQVYGDIYLDYKRRTPRFL